MMSSPGMKTRTTQSLLCKPPSPRDAPRRFQFHKAVVWMLSRCILTTGFILVISSNYRAVNSVLERSKDENKRRKHKHKAMRTMQAKD